MKRLITLALALALAFSFPALANDDDKVGVCHATGSASNPYVHIVVDRSGWDNGHSKHEGDFLSNDPNCPKPTAKPSPTKTPVASQTAAPTQTPAQAPASPQASPTAPQRTAVPQVRTLPSTSTK